MIWVLLIAVFILSFFLTDAILLKWLRAKNTGPAFFIALAITTILWVFLNGGIK